MKIIVLLSLLSFASIQCGQSGAVQNGKNKISGSDFIASIVNFRHKESLKSGDEAGWTERHVHTEKTTSDGNKPESWILESTGAKQRYKIRSKDTDEYLFASEEMKDPLRRKVFTLITNSPVGHAIPTLGSEAEWELQKDSVGYLLKNVKYGEFLYAAADDQSLVKGIRSIFTWKAKGSPGDDIGTEAHWEFTKYSE